jgi:hypothetical protein
MGLLVKTRATPDTPGTGYSVLYPKADGLWYFRDDVGVETPLKTPSTVMRSYLAGCTMSTAGSSTTMSIAAGSATDTTNVSAMALAAIAKTTSAWALGTAAGGLDTGSIATNTWYAFYVIQRPDTGVVDLTFSTNGTTPALPTNYTLYRRIGWGRTNGSSQWTLFRQDSDRFIWAVPVQDVNGATATGSRTARTLSAPPLSVVIADIFMNTTATGVTQRTLLTSDEMTDTAVSDSAKSLNCRAANDGASAALGAEFQFRLNASRQMYDRGDAACNMIYITRGWIDARGRDA